MTNDNIFSVVNNNVVYFKNIDNEDFIGEVTIVKEEAVEQGGRSVGMAKTVRQKLTFKPGVTVSTLAPGYAYAFANELAVKVRNKQDDRNRYDIGSAKFNKVLSEILCVPYVDSSNPDIVENFVFENDTVASAPYQMPSKSVQNHSEVIGKNHVESQEAFNVDLVDQYSDEQLASFYGEQSYIEAVQENGKLHHTQRNRIINELKEEALNPDA